MKIKDEDREKLSDELLEKLNTKEKKPPKTILKIRLAVFHFFHRLWHIIFVLPLILITILIHFLLIIRLIFKGKKIFNTEEFYGKKGQLVSIKYFNINTGKNFALFYYVISGKLSLTGYSLNRERKVGDKFIYDYAPGIINLWFIRSISRTGYEGLKETDKEYVHKELLRAESNPGVINFLKLLKAEFLLMIRFLIAKLLKMIQGKKKLTIMLDPIFLFKIRLRNISMQKTLQDIENTIELYHDNYGNSVRRKIYFINPDCINKTFSAQYADYQKILCNLDRKDWVFADGIGINLASDMMGYPKNENINGTDLLPRLVELSEKKKYSLYLLGAREGVAENMKLMLEKKYPEIIIKGTFHGYFDWQKDSKLIVEKINKLKVDILLVAFGTPYQERWIEMWFSELNCPFVIGVGGLFDFYSGRIKRAPRWLRDIGLEWFFRLIMEPKRMFKRYIIGNPLFLRRVWVAKRIGQNLVKRIKWIKKKKKFEVLNPSKSGILNKGNIDLIDLMPILFKASSKEDFPIFIWNSQIENLSLQLTSAFPDGYIKRNTDIDKSEFALIISDDINYALKTLNNSEKKPLCIIIDSDFLAEFNQLAIIENSHKV